MTAATMNRERLFITVLPFVLVMLETPMPSSFGRPKQFYPVLTHIYRSLEEDTEWQSAQISELKSAAGVASQNSTKIREVAARFQWSLKSQ